MHSTYNPLPYEMLAKHRHLRGKKNQIFSSFASVSTWIPCLVWKIQVEIIVITNKKLTLGP
jgi:hypothetical protein